MGKIRSGRHVRFALLAVLFASIVVSGVPAHAQHRHCEGGWTTANAVSGRFCYLTFIGPPVVARAQGTGAVVALRVELRRMEPVPYGELPVAVFDCTAYGLEGATCEATATATHLSELSYGDTLQCFVVGVGDGTYQCESGAKSPDET